MTSVSASTWAHPHVHASVPPQAMRAGTDTCTHTQASNPAQPGADRSSQVSARPQISSYPHADIPRLLGGQTATPTCPPVADFSCWPSAGSGAWSRQLYPGPCMHPEVQPASLLSRAHSQNYILPNAFCLQGDQGTSLGREQRLQPKYHMGTPSRLHRCISQPWAAGGNTCRPLSQD